MGFFLFVRKTKCYFYINHCLINLDYYNNIPSNANQSQKDIGSANVLTAIPAQDTETALS